MTSLPIQIKILAVLTALLGLGYCWHEEWETAQSHRVVIKRDPKGEHVLDHYMPATAESMRRQEQEFKALGRGGK